MKIDIYDIKGNNITKSNESENYSAGHYNIIWDASMYSSGIYFVKMISNDFIETKKENYVSEISFETKHSIIYLNS